MPLMHLFRGKRIRLTSLNRTDIPTLTRWYQDGDFLRMFDAVPAYPETEEKWQKWLEEQEAKPDVYLFAIRPLESDDLIGWIELDTIQWNNRNVWLGIGIGETGQRGKGIGQEAMCLLLDFAFFELNLHRVQLSVFEYNQPAIRLYERLGFVREGTYREYIHRDGRHYDMYLYGLLDREWTEQKKSLSPYSGC